VAGQIFQRMLNFTKGQLKALFLAPENIKCVASLAMKMLDNSRICPAVFVIGNKSLNRSKNDQEAGMRLWPISLDWKSKAIRLVSHVARHVHRIGCTRQRWGD
jgi:hypothetical protein